MSGIAAANSDLAWKHRARQLAYWNGLLWAIGNGLSSTTLVVYLAMELHAERIGWSIGLILAARHFVGVLRLGAPTAIDRWIDRKRFCLACFAVSGLLLLGLPFVAAPGVLATAEDSVWALIAVWCLHHLMQYLGTIALFFVAGRSCAGGDSRSVFRSSRAMAGCRRSGERGRVRSFRLSMASDAFAARAMAGLRHSGGRGRYIHAGGNCAACVDAARDGG